MKMTEKVKKGDKVKLHYTGRIKDGDVFDSSKKREPLQFEAGAGQVIQAMDKAVIGMEAGERKNFTVGPEEGFGQYNENLLLEMPIDKMPQGISPKKGLQLQLVNEEGKSVPVRIAEVHDKFVKLDANHPLAGKELDFEVELLDIG
jgi:FKBP-type peptidyl-prolyl cis-trans isomerase 2